MTLYLVVSLVSGCSLVLEIVAARILAPYIGVSLYTWTSIIGVMLAGISLGSYTGGRVADRWATPRTLGAILLAGGLCSLLILVFVPLAGERTLFRPSCAQGEVGFLGPLCLPQLVMLARIVLLTAAIFGLPSVMLGMVLPVVARLALGNLRTAGATVGRIYACSALGSILATFLTGFWLVPVFGTRTVVLGAGLALVALAVVAGGFWRVRRPVQIWSLIPVLVALGFVLHTIGERRALSSDCYAETGYFCIRIYDLAHERGKPLRVLQLDHLVHSYSALDEPGYYEYAYVRIYAELADYVASERPDFSTLFVGGGGYTLPRGLEVQYPGASIDVVEIDPGVTRAAYDRLGLPADTRIVSRNEDGRAALEALRGGPRYDLVFGDAFNDISVPYHLTTLEFDQQIRDLLRHDGFYLLNVIDRFRGGLFLPSVVRTLRQVFPHVYLLTPGMPWKSISGSPSTYVVAATARPLDVVRLRTVRPQGAGASILTNVMPDDVMDAWLDESGGLVLTDEYAPTDNLLAPLFAERGI